ncbi:Asp-tRNA(Asn)/Glu-tRNA(Gln) amidotransferase subunit GatC [Campylobacter sp. TTU-622]|uniref:Asp-tRNA(Asn)/Glu-tRNA(Gln) amidotransferase subunit GatC n=1 Tax=unclassified Campylobacter TaxID=2593542 RepID=UPI001906B0DB|nr:MULTISPECIES: Asp-tRNA(Asn)/Glu-tRNA(Gln) amidotransferase subunit GatC [unclassified Campylobacter]MBK1972095.1 Asp-tRNA(Asn)/Glu-tRNA(Gln) amidotransferase subunit GatC [Campylobacter sp. TTU_617]MBK1973288.1 Asp-tRNA(Asn)/Glu-tRNA(Gln) amidotransferase subunit GatC [Campylobacter sp. TTU-622]MBK1991790.1 Asp-tRNA(Asn)/Glu-tRNA(Gln) amidotransferase subunit GatC [Campylobacter sp. 2018MI34]
MQIDTNLLEKLERLSALRIADDKREKLISELSEIVDFVEKLNEINLNSLESAISPIENSIIFRNDEVKNSNVVNEIFKHSPSCQEHFFIVPKIID